MSSVALVLYVLILIVIARNREKFAFAYYKFLFALGIAEIYLLLYQGPFASFCLLRGLQLGSDSCEIPLGVDRVLASLAWWVWQCEYPIDLLVASDRFVAVVFFRHHQTIFSRRAAIAMCVGAWTFAFVTVSPILFWVVPAVFYVGEMSQDYETWETPSQMYDLIVGQSLHAILLLSLVLYVLAIGALIVRTRRKVGQVASSGAVNMKPEHKLLIQSSLRFTTIIAYDILWVVQRNPDVWTFYVANVILIGIPLSTTVVTLCLNGEIRGEVKRLLGCFLGASHATNAVQDAPSRWAARSMTTGTTVARK